MIILVLLIFAISVPMVIGFRKSWPEQRAERCRSAAFRGYSLALLALAAAILWLLGGQVQSPTSTQQAFVFVIGVISNVSAAAALVCGLFSRGTQRLSLIAFGMVMQVIIVLGAFSNFGA